jgi:outer membrane protein TolC
MLMVPIDYAGQSGRRIDARIAQHEAVIAAAEATRRDLARQAAERFVDALEAALARIRAAEAAEADAALLHAFEQRMGVGEATALEVHLARLATASGVARRAEAEGRERAARIALSILLGDVDGSLAPVGDLAVAPRAFDADALVQEALSHRPEIRAAQMQQATAERERDLASAARWPEVDVQVGWIHSFASLAPSLFNQPEYDALILGATIEIPLRLAWDGDLRVADSAIDHAQAAVRAAELTVSVEVREALAEYESARDQLAAREAALAEATALRQAATEALSRGASTVVEQLAAHAAAREAEAAYLAAAAAHARTLAILLARVGRDETVL